jgi:hypothetical protein
MIYNDMSILVKYYSKKGKSYYEEWGVGIMLKRATLGAMVGVIILLTGCSASGVTNVPPMTLEEVAGKRLAQLSQDEKDGLIYQFVSDRIRVDKDRLIKVEQKDLTAVTSLLGDITSFLKGTNNTSIKESYANYLLSEFARTPYEWAQSKIDVVGFDPAARLYFVDVTYTTTGTFKNVVPSSKIPYGSPNEDLLKQKRYQDYLNYLTLKSRGNTVEAQTAITDFANAWGSLDVIFKEQQGTSLVERTRAMSQASGGLGKLTYSGLVQDSKFSGGATMTMRYIFKYKFNLGEETDLELTSLYLKGYQLNNAETLLKDQATTNGVGAEVLKPFIDKTIVSYHKAVEESNYTGLYSLFFDYAGVDKYYDDISKYMYNSIGGYNFTILERSGTNVTVQVNRVNQLRAKGAEMSLPTYDEVLIYNLVLDADDKIKLRSVNLVKSTLVGEPISVIKNVNGISDLIQYSGESFTESNKAKVEEALKNFSKVVFNAKVDVPEFSKAVDIGVSQIALKKMSDVITAIPESKKKVNYIVSWDTKTNVYVSVTMREIFEVADGNLDTESVVDLVNRNNEWKVVNYTRTQNIKTSSVTMNTKNALSEDVR